MNRPFSIPVGIILAVAALVALYGGYAATVPSTAAVDEDRIVTVQGLLHLDDGDVIVEISVVVHPGEDGETRARDALHDLYPDAALQTWTDVPTSSFAYAYGGTTSRCPSLYSGCPGSQVFDGYNDLGWDGLPGGVLGVATYGIGIDEVDIIIDNDSFVWHTGALPVPSGSFDLETVNLHELGGREP